jgi:hypothetical protein
VTIEIERLREENAKLRGMVDAAVEFLRTELEWQYWRAEWMYYDDQPRKSQSLENARKLKNFLVANGYRAEET